MLGLLAGVTQKWAYQNSAAPFSSGRSADSLALLHRVLPFSWQGEAKEASEGGVGDLPSPCSYEKLEDFIDFLHVFNDQANDKQSNNFIRNP